MTSNVDAIYAEYPFLKNFAPRLSVRHGKVSRFNEDMFDMFVLYWMGDGYARRLILLLDQDGRRVARVGEGKWLKFVTRNETVGQALVRIGELSQKVHYVLIADPEPLWLFRLPNDAANAADWLEKRIEAGRAELQSE